MAKTKHLMTAFGSTFKQWMRANGVSTQEVVLRTGLYPQTVKKICEGDKRRTISLATLDKLQRGLGLTITIRIGD